MNINDILKDYTTGRKTLEQANAALRKTGAGFHLDPGRNEITEADRRQTVVGYYPEQACGFGLLDTGTGTLDKVSIFHGRLEHPVNALLPDGAVNSPAYVTICGKTYGVRENSLTEDLQAERPKKKPLPVKADLRRRTDLAGQTVQQHTRSGDYTVTYNGQGYAVKASRAGEVPAEARKSNE